MEPISTGKIGIGGAPQMVRFASVELQLYRSLLVDDEDPIVEWTANVGFFSHWRPHYTVVLRRDRFLDRFTMTTHGGVPAFVIGPWDAFDKRFPVQIENADTSQPRFKP